MQHVRPVCWACTPLDASPPGVLGDGDSLHPIEMDWQGSEHNLVAGDILVALARVIENDALRWKRLCLEC